MDDEYTYLQPDFDPNSLTVPRLRSILVAHNVGYPSSAKKSDLVGLFNDNVVPQARKLLNAQSRTKRSARGIVDVPSSQSTVAEDDDVEEDVAPTPARRSTRRATRPAAEDDVEPTPRSRRSVATPSTVKRQSAKHARLDEDSEQPEEHEVKRATSKRSRQSVPAAAAPPPVVSDPDEPVYYQGPESPFTRDNPFQSGSPPPSADRSKSGERRRTTMNTATDRERRKSRESRRVTDSYKAVKQNDGVVVPSSSTFDMPVSRVKAEPRYEVDDTSAGEEFVPEEQMDLDLVKAQERGQMAVARRPRRKQQKSGVAKAAPWTVLLAMLGGVATVWRQEKLQVGYCGVGEPSTSFGGVDIPDWASFLQPQCEPCPQHAYCYADLKTVCEQDFILTPHPLSAGGLVPLPPTCEPDSEKVRKIKAVADFAVDSELRSRNAQYECGEAASPEISEPELKKMVSAKRSRRMTDEEFDELWGSAIGEVVGREEVVSKIEGQSGLRLLRSTSLARIPLACAFRRSLRLALRQHLPKLVTLLFLSLSAGYGRYALTTRRSTKTQAKRLAGQALDKLATQASLHADDPVGYPEPWISMVALRDDVLREEFRTKERTRLWDVVKGLVEGNANVRTMVREGRTGEVSRVWEWIGAVHRIEAGASSSRRQSGAVGRIAGSPGRMIDLKADGESLDESSFVASANGKGKWEEGRTYY
ncbi:hypothetical protein MBLNU459_g1759t1 [Dothideomycetes sp. NU459]